MKKFNIFNIFFITIAIMLFLLALGIDIFVAALITIIVILFGNFLITFTLGLIALRKFDYQCDPKAFIKYIEKQRASMGSNKKGNIMLDINFSAGLMAQGKYEEAKKVLLSIDKNKIMKSNQILFICIYNLFGCYYELKDFESIDELYNSKEFSFIQVNSKTEIGFEALKAQRLFYEKNYGECREVLSKISSRKISKRVQLEILDSLAQIDEEEGNLIEARKKYEIIVSEGNKLWITNRAKEKCEFYNA